MFIVLVWERAVFLQGSCDLQIKTSYNSIRTTLGEWLLCQWLSQEEDWQFCHQSEQRIWSWCAFSPPPLTAWACTEKHKNKKSRKFLIPIFWVCLHEEWLTRNLAPWSWWTAWSEELHSPPRSAACHLQLHLGTQWCVRAENCCISDRPSEQLKRHIVWC